MNFFKKTPFWSILIAAVALILSQLQPIKEWREVKDTRLIVAERVGIVSNIGKSGYIMHIDRVGDGFVGKSRDAYRRIYPIIVKAIESNEEVSIRISNLG